jgi:RNA polymerase sigma-70 factor (ECF subfamily)
LTAANYFEEKELVSRLIVGDEAAFKILYDRYSERLHGFLLKLLKIDTAAVEILQDTFVKVWTHRAQIDPQQSFRSYLFRIAENAACDFFRKAGRDKKLREKLISIASSQYKHVEEQAMVKEEVQHLYAAINALPPQRRQVFQLVKMEGKSYAEVSRELNISASTISDHIVKATRYLRRRLQKEQSAAMLLLLSYILH